MHPTDDVHARGAAMIAKACRDHDEFAGADPLYRFLWSDDEVRVVRCHGGIIMNDPAADRRRTKALRLINEMHIGLAKALDEA